MTLITRLCRHWSHRQLRRSVAGGALLLVAAGAANASGCLPAQARVDLVAPAVSVPYPANVAIGKAISNWISVNASQADASYFVCSSETVSQASVTGAEAVIGSYQDDDGSAYSLFDTGIPGVGMAIRVRALNASTNSPVRAGSAGRLNMVPIDGRSGFQHDVRYVRTGDVSAGTFTGRASDISRISADAGSGGVLTSLQPNLGVQAAACVLTATAQTVYLGSILSSSLAVIGDGTPVQSFGWRSDCAGSSPAQVDVTYSSLTPVIGSGGGLAEVTGGAEGIAFEVFRAVGGAVPEGTPVTFGTVYPMGATSTNPGEDLSVRYVRTGTLKTGIANGGVTISLSYR